MTQGSLRFRLWILVIILSTLTVGLGTYMAVGLVTTNEAIHAIQRDQLVPMSQLKKVSDAYAVKIVDSTHKVRLGISGAPEGQKNLQEARQTIASQWQAYTATKMSQEEAAIAQSAATLMQGTEPTLTKLEGLFNRNDLAGLQTFASAELYQAIDPLSAQLDRLHGIQLTSAAQTAMASQATVRSHLFISLFALLSFLGVAYLLGRSMVRGVQRSAEGLLVLARHMETGDFSHPAEVHSQDELGQAATALNAAAANLRRMLMDIQGVADNLASGVNQLSASSEELSHTSVENARNLDGLRLSTERTATAIHEMSESIREISSIGRASQEEAQKSLGAAEAGSHAGARARQAMEEIQTSMSRMVLAVRVIQEIAKQTNLLSLNAAIEAAKAGAMGKGFAVVAEEVRKLAERSGQSAREIGGLIEGVEENGRKGLLTAGETAVALERISGQVSGLVARAQEIGTSTQEQARAAEDVNHAILDITDRTQMTATATEQTSATVGEVARTSQELATLADQLRKMVAGFRV